MNFKWQGWFNGPRCMHVMFSLLSKLLAAGTILTTSCKRFQCCHYYKEQIYITASSEHEWSKYEYEWSRPGGF